LRVSILCHRAVTIYQFLTSAPEKSENRILFLVPVVCPSGPLYSTLGEHPINSLPYELVWIRVKRSRELMLSKKYDWDASIRSIARDRIGPVKPRRFNLN
jgi:hypothetical protein